jgi:hypothetical protein
MDWNKEHEENWGIGIVGPYQTYHFISSALSNLNIRQWGRLCKARNILDYGCAWGQATELLSHFSKTVGYDSSSTAISEARTTRPGEFHGHGEFTNNKPDISAFDIVYCSNVMEHGGLDISDLIGAKMSIILVPHDQILDGWPNENTSEEKPGGHSKSMSIIDFPKTVGHMRRTTYKHIPEISKELCQGAQLLVIYEVLDEELNKDINFKKKQSDEFYSYLIDNKKYR